MAGSICIDRVGEAGRRADPSRPPLPPSPRHPGLDPGWCCLSPPRGAQSTGPRSSPGRQKRLSDYLPVAVVAGLCQSASEGVVMRRAWLLFFATTILHSPCMAQVPEEIHSDAQGEGSVCGITGDGALAIRDALRSDSNINQEPSPSQRFETYFSAIDTKQWTVTTKSDAAYPAVTCVFLFNSSNGVEMQRQMRCDASREACDALFLEFRSNDDRVRRQLRGE